MAGPDVNPNGPVFGCIWPVPDLTLGELIFGVRPNGAVAASRRTLRNHWQNRSRGNSTKASPVATFSPAWFFTTTSIKTQRDFSVVCLDLMIPVGWMVSPGRTGLTISIL